MQKNSPGSTDPQALQADDLARQLQEQQVQQVLEQLVAVRTVAAAMRS